MEELRPDYSIDDNERVEFEEIPVPEFEREREFGVPEEWPKFPVGRVIELDGIQFEVKQVNLSSIAIRPVPINSFWTRRKIMEMIRG